MKEALFSRAKVTGAPNAKGRATSILLSRGVSSVNFRLGTIDVKTFLRF